MFDALHKTSHKEVLRRSRAATSELNSVSLQDGGGGEGELYRRAPQYAAHRLLFLDDPKWTGALHRAVWVVRTYLVLLLMIWKSA